MSNGTARREAALPSSALEGQIWAVQPAKAVTRAWPIIRPRLRPAPNHLRWTLSYVVQFIELQAHEKTPTKIEHPASIPCHDGMASAKLVRKIIKQTLCLNNRNRAMHVIPFSFANAYIGQREDRVMETERE